MDGFIATELEATIKKPLPQVQNSPSSVKPLKWRIYGSIGQFFT